MLVLASEAVSKDVGLIVTFIGIGIVVNVLIVYALFQVRGEHLQNKEDAHRGRSLEP
ncbi:MAG TPA: hypothetical protein VEJ23_08780 [Solirubrobacteraceae bacterium]|nr:hypothetical protein [Solirubrobacteraceae bacterium]